MNKKYFLLISLLVILSTTIGVTTAEAQIMESDIPRTNDFRIGKEKTQITGCEKELETLNQIIKKQNNLILKIIQETENSIQKIEQQSYNGVAIFTKGDKEISDLDDTISIEMDVVNIDIDNMIGIKLTNGDNADELGGEVELTDDEDKLMEFLETNNIKYYIIRNLDNE